MWLCVRWMRFCSQSCKRFASTGGKRCTGEGIWTGMGKRKRNSIGGESNSIKSQIWIFSKNFCFSFFCFGFVAVVVILFQVGGWVVLFSLSFRNRTVPVIPVHHASCFRSVNSFQFFGASFRFWRTFSVRMIISLSLEFRLILGHNLSPLYHLGREGSSNMIVMET